MVGLTGSGCCKAPQGPPAPSVAPSRPCDGGRGAGNGSPPQRTARGGGAERGGGARDARSPTRTEGSFTGGRGHLCLRWPGPQRRDRTVRRSVWDAPLLVVPALRATAPPLPPQEELGAEEERGGGAGEEEGGDGEDEEWHVSPSNEEEEKRRRRNFPKTSSFHGRCLVRQCIHIHTSVLVAFGLSPVLLRVRGPRIRGSILLLLLGSFRVVQDVPDLRDDF